MIPDKFFEITDYHQICVGEFTNVPAWDDVIKQIDYCYRRKLLAQNSSLGMKCEHGYNYKQITPLQEKIVSNNSSDYIFTYDAYISLSSESKTFGKHNDTVHTWFWQCVGKTKWTVWDDKEYTYILNPGDVIFVPSEMYHLPIPLTPRMGLSLGLS